VPHASGGWVNDARFPKLKVAFAARALKDIAAAEKRLERRALKATLKDILSQDLRNPRDRSQNEEGLELGFFLYDFEVRFAVRKKTATVLKLLTGTTMHKKERREPPKKIALA
jgi:hypothetical protein